MKKFSIAYLFIIGIILAITGFVVYNFYIIPSITKNDSNIESTDYVQKKHNVNDYTVVNVDERQMISLYFNNFIGKVYSDVESSYNLINDDYKDVKFENLEEYKEYMKLITADYMIYPSIKSYRVYKTSETESTVYQVEDSNGYEYYFRASAVMDYDVYFDDETITIE